ncbi:sensor histidine kinase [Sinorhizobium mexicanum]|nr:ATP-binding protein [Sinorhizobium mexicanum]MBP1886760.1 signal transduction histidine kinase [Sinorhizobium mexicanum]
MEIPGRRDISAAPELDDYRPTASAVERERRRLARDIHDLSGQYIVAALFRLDALERASGDGALSRHCNEVREMLVQLSRELETVTSGTESAAPGGADLITALSGIIGRWEDHIGIATRFLHEAARDFRIDDATAETLFRITQEGLTNIAKHAASASLVTIRLRQVAACLVLTIEDDGTGKGRQPVPEDRGFHRPSGIAGMRERVAELGGTLTLERTARGTRLTVAVPTERSNVQQCERGLA